MIQSRFIVEAQGKPKSFVDSTLKKHIEKMKGVKGIEVYDIKQEPTEKMDEGFFSALADVGVRCQDFEVFVASLLGFAPTAVIIEEPESIEVDMRELQNIANDLVQIFHTFAQANAQLRMKLQNKGKGTKVIVKSDE